MSLPSKSRRRLLISLGLLGLGGALFRPARYQLEIYRMARVWEEKWHKSLAVQNEHDKTRLPENVRQVPTLIENDLTLKQADSPWIIDDDVLIRAGVTLTIEAGSEIFIGRENHITVKGRILAQGEAANPVRLRAYSSADTDKWAGIFIIQTDMPSVFQYVEFENSYYGARLVHTEGTWISCSFINVREVCSAFKSETVFRNCLVDYKDYPGSGNINVFKFQNGTARMEDCSIHCPDSDYKVDGIDADYLVKGIFRGNRLYGGICPGADAIDIGRGSRNILIENNIITDFVDKGISVGEAAQVMVNNNIIARCAIGVGVKDDAHATISRSTFYENGYAVNCYEKVAGQGGGHAEASNCIIASSRKAPFAVDKQSSISFTATLCDQQLLPGKDNLLGTPVFEVIEKDRFNCTGITRAGSTSSSCRLSGAPAGARVDSYPNG